MSTKKPKTNQDQQMKALIEKEKRQKAAVQEYKNRIRPFVRFLKKKQLRFNHARVANSRVEYFRIDEFDKILSSNTAQIESNEDIKNIVKQIREELIYFKRPSHLKAKYPDMLEPVAPDSSQKKYACFRFDTTQSKKWMMFGIIFLVLSMVLFPIWPFQLKYGIWLISFYLLIFIISLIVIRLVIYLICVMFGYNVWIFPNLFGDQGFIDSFKPIFYYQKWQKNWYNTLIRVFVISSIVAYGCYIYLNPTAFFESIQATKQTARDIHDWGVQKIKNQKNFSQRAITNLQHILNETADIKDSKESQYTSFNQSIDSQL